MRICALLAGTAGATVVLVVPGTARGSLSITAPANAAFSATLTGLDQATTYTVGLTIGVTVASRAAGWNLTGTATQLTSGGNTLPATAQAITAVANAGCTTIAPTNSVGLPVTLGAAATKFYNAAGNTGYNNCVITPTITVSIPGSSFAAAYTSTLTFAVVAGP